MKRTRHPSSVFAILVVLTLISAACESPGETTSTKTVIGTTAAPAPETSSTTGEPSSEGFTYTVGMRGDIVERNFWAFYGPDGNLIMDWVFGRTKPALFRIAYPGIVVAPDVAVGLPVAAVQEGEVWTVTQPIRDDYTWSDGSLLTADDIVFTYETVRDVGLGPLFWWESYPYTEGSSPRLLRVEAVDDFTVQYTFDSQPGAAIWPHEVGVAPIMPRAPWEAVVAEAILSEDPPTVLYDSDAVEVGDLSGGPVSYAGREEGVSVETVGNDNYANTGFVHQFWADGSYALNGELLYGEGIGDPVVEYTEGPYLERTVFSIYDNEEAGMLALIDGEIDYWFPPNTVATLSRCPTNST